MTKPEISQANAFGIDLFWLLRLLAQLPPFEVKVNIPGSDDKLKIIFDLEITQ